MQSKALTNQHIQLPFRVSHAFIVGINAYEHLTPLSTAVNDAKAIAKRLSEQHGFRVHPPVLNASYQELLQLLTEVIPKSVDEDDRVLFYFAGHGIALDGEEGPNGYLVAANTRPGEEQTLIPMQLLHDSLTQLPCRHGLLILDCCFSGAFKWSSGFRDVIFDLPKIIYEERFWRYCKDPAWQVITSSAHDQKAVDIITNQSLGLREATGNLHSPFAHSLLQALDGKGDMIPAGTGDGVMTATELYSYLRDSVETSTSENAKRQSPSIFNLKRHDKGEFIFLNPNHRFNLPPTPDRNPFMGLSSYNEEDATLFYGRDRVVDALLDKVKQHALVVVSGASGTGKSSVIKAGVLPQLRQQGFTILPIIRPGKEPLQTIATELPDIEQALAAKACVLVIDQYEELITQCLRPEDRIAFEERIATWLQQYSNLCLLLSVRSDFEPQFESEILAPWWSVGRYVVPAFSLEEIREVITKPAAQAVLFYEPEDLVDQLSEEVSQAPGALPLLSFTLSELYHAYLKSGREDRSLALEDYEKLGGVIGALRTRADAEYTALEQEEQSSMRKLMLRMVSLEGGELAGKRVFTDELQFTAPQESARLLAIAEKLVNARLLLQGTDGQGRSFIEPAHDALVRAWARLWEWIKAVGEEKISLQYKLSQAVNDYHSLLESEPKKARNLLWNNNPRLDLLQAELQGKDHGLNAQEEAFVRASVQRRSARRRTGWAIAIGVMIGLAGLSVYAFAQRDEALTQTKIAQEKTIEAQDSALVAKQQRQVARDKAQEALDSAYSANQSRIVAENARAEIERQYLALIAEKKQRARILIKSFPARLNEFEFDKIELLLEELRSLNISEAETRKLTGHLLLYYLLAQEQDNALRLFKTLTEETVSIAGTDTLAYLSQRWPNLLSTIQLQEVYADYYPSTIAVTGGTYRLPGTAFKLSATDTIIYQLDDFRIGPKEVSILQYYAFCKATNRPFSLREEMRADYPITEVDWLSAIQYCNWLSRQFGLEEAYQIINDKEVSWNSSANGYRLLTEAEWRYAAAGGQSELMATGFPATVYAGSDTPEQVAWYSANSEGIIWPRGRKKSNALGLYDMTGNAYEWCWDWYSARPPTPNTVQYNPRGPQTGTTRVNLGGGFESRIDYCSIYHRSKDRPESQVVDLGFRIARNR